MNILITGATGFLGRHLVHHLLTRGHQIRACVRDPQNAHLPAKVDCITTDFMQLQTPESWREHLQDIDVVINAVGIIREQGPQRFACLHEKAPKALFQACANHGVRRVVQISALGADAQADTAYHRSKFAADQFLRQTAKLDWYVLRPSIIWGGASTALFQGLAALPLLILPNIGKAQIQPVLLEDMLAIVTRCAEGRIPAHSNLDVVGSQRYHLDELLQSLRQYLGAKTSAITGFVPAFMMGWLLSLLGLLGLPLNRDLLRMLQRGNCADTEQLHHQTGIAPQSLQNWLEANPPSQAERWQARLYWLRPLLRLSIALVWIVTGLVSAFFYPVTESYALLAPLGIHDYWAGLALYAAAGLDLFLGFATLFGWRLRSVVTVQISLMLGYTLLISLYLPAFWLHPFSPILKNLPLLVASLIMLALEEEKP